MSKTTAMAITLVWASAIAQTMAVTAKTHIETPPSSAARISPAPPAGGNFCRTMTLRYRDGRIELK